MYQVNANNPVALNESISSSNSNCQNVLNTLSNPVRLNVLEGASNSN